MNEQEPLSSHEVLPKILCVFCNEPWDQDMKVALDWISAGCDTCGYGSTANITLTITCTGCKRVIYKKDMEVER